MHTDGSDGTQDARGIRPHPVPRPAGPPPSAPPAPAAPPPPAAPPVPGQAPGTRGGTREWLDAPRPDAAPGLWRQGYVRPAPKAEERSGLSRPLLISMLISFLSGALLWSLWQDGDIPYQFALLRVFTPNDWFHSGTTAPVGLDGSYALDVYSGAVFALLVFGFGRIGNWRAALRFFVEERPQPGRALASALLATGLLLLIWNYEIPLVYPVLSLLSLVFGEEMFRSQFLTYSVYTLITLAVLWPFMKLGDWPGLVRTLAARGGQPGSAPLAAGPPAVAAAEWPELREAGQHQAAELLAAELRAGRMNDVDCARIRRAWDTARRDPGRVKEFADTVLREGAAAFTHPSGDRDVPGRSARHDLLTGQVRLGACVDDDRNEAQSRGAGAALDPAVLGTSLLAVGPPGAGKTRHLVRPVVEALTLQALTGGCAVIAVGTAGVPLGPDEAFDVVVKPGNPASAHDLDLYAGTADPDEAAAFLAEGLVGDLESVDTRRAATALAQLLGPYRAVHGHFPPVPELCELLQGLPGALDPLREALAAAGQRAMLRELEARSRQAGGATDPAPALADRLGLLDRPAFADFFATGGGSGPLSLRAVARHPLRVRIELPGRPHEEAARLLARLVLAQFLAVTADRAAPGHFACLVLDDAGRTLSRDTVGALHRLRAAHAGVVLALRSMSEVPEPLHGPLHGAVGCRAAFSGVTTWDGRGFAAAWGTKWVETREVAKHTVFADQPLTRALHALRRLATGKEVTTDAVTVRQVERDHWSASELAQELPPGHAVLSVTTVDGTRADPLLVDLRS
ncbi:ATP/GTP-binding protein [Streptomyces physcomitrii]|uniref:ATP/GTP-binding protein n=1 Tax=Streptomyces physcomitrii TaxID=2724184 RepID=UPI0033FEAB68